MWRPFLFQNFRFHAQLLGVELWRLSLQEYLLLLIIVVTRWLIFRRIWFFCSVFNYRAIIFWTPGRIMEIFWAKLRRKSIVFSLIEPRRFLKQLASIFNWNFKLRGNASKWGKFEGSLYKMCYPQFVCNH